MTQTEIAERLQTLTQGKVYEGTLTPFIAQSIEQSRTNYSVGNLLQYCQDMNVVMAIRDELTWDSFVVDTPLKVHEVLQFLSDRYEIGFKAALQKRGVHYTSPTDKGFSLSIRTLLTACEAIHCSLSFEVN